MSRPTVSGKCGRNDESRAHARCACALAHAALLLTLVASGAPACTIARQNLAASDIIIDGWISILEQESSHTAAGRAYSGIAQVAPRTIRLNKPALTPPFRFRFYFIHDAEGCVRGVLPFDTPPERPVRVYLRRDRSSAAELEVLSIEEPEEYAPTDSTSSSPAPNAARRNQRPRTPHDTGPDPRALAVSASTPDAAASRRLEE